MLPSILLLKYNSKIQQECIKIVRGLAQKSRWLGQFKIKNNCKTKIYLQFSRQKKSLYVSKKLPVNISATK